MMRIWGILYLFSIALTAINVNGQNLPQNEWSKVAGPTKELPHPIGFYSNGCIGGASPLPLNGIGFQVMRPFRNRYYGHPETVQFVQELGKTMDALGSGILIGDMGQPRGGPLPYGHASHQLGLDVDIWFWTHPEQRSRLLTESERNTLPFVNMLNSNGLVDPTKFTQEQILKLKSAAANPWVQRIFVNPAIKVYLCSTLPKNELEWLHVLRPWPGHHEHFHVRLRCPKGSAQCTSQDEQPIGDGCSEVLPPRKIMPESDIHMTETEIEDQFLDQLMNSNAEIKTIPSGCLSILKEPSVSAQSLNPKQN